MEAVFYNHAVEEAAIRRAVLRQALHAFLADPSSRSSVQLIGLFVRIPAPSIVTAAAATASAPPTASSTRQRSAQRLAWCALEAERRLRQACEDAQHLNDGLLHGTLTAETITGARHRTGASSSPRVVGAVRVVVVAHLAPHSREDLTVYESWQRCAERSVSNTSASHAISQTTRRLSPLRRAHFVAVSLGAPALLLSWAEKSTRCHLDGLLLPHQTLLFDLSWVVSAAATPNVEVVETTRGAAVAKGKSAGRVTTHVLLDLFFHDVLPSVKLPKGDSRAALWVSYAALMAALHPRVFHGDGAADLSFTVSASSSSGGGDAQRRRRDAADQAPETNASAFVKTHRLLRQLFSTLFGSGIAAAGRTQALRVLLGYGGLLAGLTRQLVHVADQHSAPANIPAKEPAAKHKNFAAAAHGVTPQPAVDAALLRTRNLVDVYALFGVLVGQDKTDFYAAAAGFVRTAARRCAAAEVAAGGSGATHRLRSAQVLVQDAHTGAVEGTPNTFVEAGARALARRQRLLERRRLGKGKQHLRPRDAAARKRKHSVEKKRKAQAAANTAVPGATSAAVGKKRAGDVASAGDVSAEGVSLGGSVAVIPKRKKTKVDSVAAAAVAAAVKTAATSEALSWSVDVGQ